MGRLHAMKNKTLIAGLIFAALVTGLLVQGGMVNAAPPAQEPTGEATARPTRDLTLRPRKTKAPDVTTEATARPTRNLTTNPKRTKTPVPTDEPAATAQPAPKNAGNVAGLSGPITSQLLILNSDRTGPANVTVNLFDVNGALAFTDSFKIKEDGAKLVAIPKTLGKEFLANARIIADRRVQALVIDRSKVGGSIDAYEVQGVAATALTLPYIRHGSTASGAAENNLIAIQNTSGITTDATLTAYDLNGNIVLTHVVTIPPQASAYLDTEDLFGATSFLGSASITADQRLAAALLSYNGEDTASLRALTTRDQANRVVVPNVERKQRKTGVIKTWHEMYVRNNAAGPTDLTISYYTSAGKLKGQVTRTNVPAGGMAQLDTSSDEFQFLGKKFGGWAVIASSDKAPIVVEAMLVQAHGNIVVGLSGAPRTRINWRNICGDIRITPKETSVLTLVNTRSKDKAVVRVRLYARTNGALVTDFTLDIPPAAQIKLSSANGLPANFQGSAIVSAEVGHVREIVATVMTTTGKGKSGKSTAGYMCR